jgi:hypothetical protein
MIHEETRKPASPFRVTFDKPLLAASPERVEGSGFLRAGFVVYLPALYLSIVLGSNSLPQRPVWRIVEIT